MTIMPAQSTPQPSLVAARIASPRIPPGAIVRASALLATEQLATVRLVMVQAPAGYGKTTAMVHQLRRLQDEARCTAWLTLDDDETADTLAAGLMATLDPLRVERRSVMREPQHPGSGTLPALLHVLHEIDDPVAIFLDDCDAPADSTVVGWLDRLIERIPLRHTVFLATWTKPALRLARHRIRGEVLDIGREQLAFAPSEAAEYLRGRGIDWLSGQQLEEIHQLTEGWPVALQMAAYVLKASGNTGSLPMRLVSPEVGLSDYLAEEILAHQTPAVRDFMLRTCILRNLHPDLCDAVTGRGDSALQLQRLLRDNLFVVELGGSGWARYHRIFRDFLFHELQRLHAIELPLMHRRAAMALGGLGIYGEALENAVAAKDAQFIAEFIAVHGRAAIQQAVAAPLATWARQQPLEALAQYPTILAATAWAHMLVRDLDRSRTEIDALRRYLEVNRGGNSLRLNLAMLEVMLAMIVAEFDRGLELADGYLRELAADKSFERGVISNVSGYAEILRGNFERARYHLAIGRECHAAVGSSFGVAFSTCHRGIMEAIQGRLNAALQIYASTDRWVDDDRQSASRAVVDAFAADVLLEQNRLPEAREKLHDSLSVANEFVFSGIFNVCHLTMIRLLAAEGDFAQALNLLDEAEHEGIRRGHARLANALRWERVRLALAMGDLAEAHAAASHIPDRDGIAVADRGAYLHYPEELDATDIGALRLKIHEGRSAEVLPTIERAIRNADADRRVWRGVRLRVLRILAQHMCGEPDRALRGLSRLLRATAHEGFVRSVLDEGPVLLDLVAQLVAAERRTGRSGTHADGAELVRVWGQMTATPGVGRRTMAPTGVLSSREHEIVGCLLEGLSNRETAARLHLAENTVKWHLRMLYEKLGVRSRTSALAALRQRGLL